MPIRIVIADDHPLMLDALERLCTTEPDLEVVARCRDGETAFDAVRRQKPDIVVLDVRMGRIDGIAVLREINKEKLPTRVVLLTAELGEDALLEATRLDVGGIVLKEMAPQLLLRCIRKVHAGEQWLENRSVARAFEKLIKREAATGAVAKIPTTREIEIVRLVASGARNKEIASQLSITEGTVKIHLHNIYEKLDVQSRLELLVTAREKGLV